MTANSFTSNVNGAGGSRMSLGILFGMLAVFPGLIATIVYTKRKTAQMSAQGGCPGCHADVPAFRRPASMRQALWADGRARTAGRNSTGIGCNCPERQSDLSLQVSLEEYAGLRLIGVLCVCSSSAICRLRGPYRSRARDRLTLRGCDPAPRHR